MKKLWIIAVAVLFGLQSGYAQKEDYTPRKGNMTAGITIGYNSYGGIDAPAQTLSDYQLSAVSTNWFDGKLMVGVQGSWFFTDNWALRFGGGLGYTYKPGYSSVPGTVGATEEGGSLAEIPNYGAVGNASTFNYTVYAGASHYWRVNNVPNMMFHVGGQFGASYGQSQIKYDDETSMGKSAAEVISGYAAGVAGVDYYVLPGMYIGAEVHALSYTYNVTGIRPQVGLKMLKADSHNVSFLAAPTLKVGFKF